MSVRELIRRWSQGWPAFAADLRRAAPKAVESGAEVVKILVLLVWPMFAVPLVFYLRPLPYDWFTVMYVAQAVWLLVGIFPYLRGRDMEHQEGEI